MRIQINEQDLREIIVKHLLSNYGMTVKEGDIDFVATRGSDGITATIDLNNTKHTESLGSESANNRNSMGGDREVKSEPTPEPAKTETKNSESKQKSSSDDSKTSSTSDVSPKPTVESDKSTSSSSEPAKESGIKPLFTTGKEESAEPKPEPTGKSLFNRFGRLS